MIISAKIQEKTMGSKLLLKDLDLTLQDNQKIAIEHKKVYENLLKNN